MSFSMKLPSKRPTPKDDIQKGDGYARMKEYSGHFIYYPTKDVTSPDIKVKSVDDYINQCTTNKSVLPVPDVKKEDIVYDEKTKKWIYQTSEYQISEYQTKTC